MSPKETLKQIRDFIITAVDLSLANEQNFPSTQGEISGAFEITVSTAGALSRALKNIPYHDIYAELDKARCFNVKMLDGGLISFLYRFSDGKITEHALSYFPSPDLELFQNEPDIYLEDEVYADAVDRNIVPFPVRFDFSSDDKKFVELDHPYSHMTLGQYKNCRIPVCSPIGPLSFGSFVLRNFYNTAYKKYSDTLPVSEFWFAKTITANESKIPHLVCSPHMAGD